MKDNKKAVIICRVSSREQENTGYSLEAQEKLLKEYASNTGMSVVKVFKISESASGKMVRKKFSEMMKYVNRNKVDLILCEKIDRLTRNMKDASVINDWVHGKDGREVHFVKENFIVSRNTRAHENLVWDMKVAVARFYTNNLSEEVRKGQKEKIAQGWFPGRSPLGYKSVGVHGHKTLVLDEKTAPLIKEIFDLYASGNHSVLSIRQKMYERGLRSTTGGSLSASMIHRYLQNPFYYGAIKWRDELYPGKHEPIISKHLFDKVQSLLKRKMISRIYTKHNYLFKGKIFCEGCRGMLTWENQKGILYGHCSNHPKYRNCPKKTYIKQKQVEEQIYTIFGKIAPKNEAVLQWIEELIKEENAEEVKLKEIELKKLNTQFENAKRRKVKYFEAKINKEVDAEYCDLKIKECKEEEGSLKSALEKVTSQGEYFQELRMIIHELAFKAREIYEKATIEEKRLLMSQLFSKITQDGYEIWPEFNLAAEYLLKWMPRLNANFEPQKSVVSPMQFYGFDGIHSLLRAWRNDLRTYIWYMTFPKPRDSLDDIKGLLSIIRLPKPT
ncbi:MAG: recombinase family protein [Bacteroidetes bacterium]|nr:MAG: recombinase family protein [Bacteroidota bacterium]